MEAALNNPRLISAPGFGFTIAFGPSSILSEVAGLGQSKQLDQCNEADFFQFIPVLAGRPFLFCILEWPQLTLKKHILFYSHRLESDKLSSWPKIHTR